MVAPYRCIQLHERDDDTPEYLTPLKKPRSPGDYDQVQTELDLMEVIAVAEALSKVGSIITYRCGLSMHVLVPILEMYTVIDNMRINQLKYNLLNSAQ